MDKIRSREELERRIAEDGLEYVKAHFVPIYADLKTEFARFEKPKKETNRAKIQDSENSD